MTLPDEVERAAFEAAFPVAKSAHLSRSDQSTVENWRTIFGRGWAARASLAAPVPVEPAMEVLRELVDSRDELRRAHDSTPGEYPFSAMVALQDRLNAAWAAARAVVSQTQIQSDHLAVPLSTGTTTTGTQAARESAADRWMDIETVIDGYIEGYTMEGDSGHHTPSEAEQFLIKDAVMGLLADPEFLALLPSGALK